MLLIHQLFEKKQAVVTYTITELVDLMDAGHIQPRDVMQRNVKLIKEYILSNIESGHVYLPPIVAGVKDETLEEKPQELLIIDGSARLKAIHQLKDYLDDDIDGDSPEEIRHKYAKHKALKDTSLSVQLFEGLSREEMDQLFVDMNSKGKKVALSKLIEYDSRNDVNRITNQVLKSNRALSVAGIEIEKQALIKPNNKKFLSLAQLRKLVSTLLTGEIKTTIPKNQLTEAGSLEKNVEFINFWFEKLFELHPCETIGDYPTTMLAGHPLLTALAHYSVRDLDGAEYNAKIKTIEERMNDLKGVNWDSNQRLWERFEGRENERWNYYQLTNDRKNIIEISNWLEQHVKEVCTCEA